jgi:hypothetical protein
MRTILCITAVLLMSACGGGEVSDSSITQEDLDATQEIDWQRLAAKKIYFGHQSVGGNIMDGVERLVNENAGVDLNLRITDRGEDFNTPVLAHTAIGENRDPQSKIDEFQRKIRGGIGEQADVAMFKFCYIDISGDTDVNAMFDEYARVMDELEREFPDVTFAHSTVPLEVAAAPWKDQVKKLIGKPRPLQAANMKRNEYNKLLMARYGGKRPVFDLAAYESAVAEGKRAAFKDGDGVYYTLNPDYSSDGSHLNDRGSDVLAAQLLVFLQSLD